MKQLLCRYKTPLSVALLLLILLAGCIYYLPSARNTLHARTWRLEAKRSYKLSKYQQGDNFLSRSLFLAPENRRTQKIVRKRIQQSTNSNELLWRMHLAHHQQWGSENLLAIAQLGLEQQRNSAVQLALSQIPEAERSSATYNNLLSSLHFQTGDVRSAYEQALIAAEAAPTNHSLRLNTLSLALQQGLPEAEAELQKELDRGELGLPLLRLQRNRLSHRDFGQAFQWSSQVIDHPEASFADQVIHFHLLKRLEQPLIKQMDWFETLKKNVGTDASRFRLLANALFESGEYNQLHQWIHSLPPEFQAEPAVKTTHMHTMRELQQWGAMISLLTTGPKWEAQEWTRQAWLAWAYRKKSTNDPRWRTTWQETQDLALENIMSARQLVRLTGSWPEWQLEWTDYLWKTIQLYPHETIPVTGLLHRHYSLKKQTRGLLRVTQKLLELKPNEPALTNNRIYYELLLTPKSQRLYQDIFQLHQQIPKNPNVKSTYALALYHQGKYEQAHGLLVSLSDKALEVPSIKALHASVLLELKQIDEAARIANSFDVKPLLPEEQDLIKPLLD